MVNDVFARVIVGILILFGLLFIWSVYTKYIKTQPVTKQDQ